ncbi:MAG: zinc ribbon domain-containing protein [Bacteroidales bacterium]
MAKEKQTEADVNNTAQAEGKEASVEQKLVALYALQCIDSRIDKIRIVRGELPLEVQDLEDETTGLETRKEKYDQEVSELEAAISEKKNAVKESQALIKRYEEQQMNVRNNREYDSLSKEIEFQSLEIQLCEKRTKEFSFKLEAIKNQIKDSEGILKERIADLNQKKEELNDIIEETKREEETLQVESDEKRKDIDERLLVAYTRIRANSKNGLAVVPVERGACGGCFSKIPPQVALDIAMHKKIIVCEFCGRILVDSEINERI